LTSRLQDVVVQAGIACALPILVTGLAAKAASQQAPAAPSPVEAVRLAERGRCREALPVLKRNPRLADQKLRYRAAMASARCAMSLNDTAGVTDALKVLRRDFPDDPEVLYVSARFYSQLAQRAAQELAARFPASAQVGKLNAEALESQRRWDEAIAAYRALLAQNPGLPEIHFRIARILLDKSSGAEAAEEAKQELEEELKINPQSAPAEFVLGEIARRAGAWDRAIPRFSRAAQLDAGFFEAHLALGMSLSAAGRYAEAVAPLETYVKMDPADPAGHYQLAIAYARTGNQPAADRHMQLHREAAAKAPMRRAQP
jgi:tetratricopeptide (TPR) repeat protein